jgi:CRP/FNR family cyclic AMP-dependent transcriptional regulator
MPDAEVADLLAAVPLFEGLGEPELTELAGVVRRRAVPEGETLWRQGDEARDVVVVVDGRVSLTLRLPGGREVGIGSAGPGDELGEIPLLDVGRRSLSAHVSEAATLLSIGRSDFAALLSRRHPSAFALKRRIARSTTARLRHQLEAVAASLGGEAATEPAADAARTFADLEFCGPPDSRYVRRMATFHSFDSLALWGFLTAGRYARCPPGRTLVAEGAPSTACYLTINGAVEKVLVRGDRRIRVGLAGPGQAFGYESLIDGGPSPVTAITRERALLLVLPQEPFERLFGGETAGSHVFLDVIHRELSTALRQALRPHARLVASVY